jgi:hypothetical protein
MHRDATAGQGPTHRPRLGRSGGRLLLNGKKLKNVVERILRAHGQPHEPVQNGLVKLTAPGDTSILRLIPSR